MARAVAKLMQRRKFTLKIKRCHAKLNVKKEPPLPMAAVIGEVRIHQLGSRGEEV